MPRECFSTSKWARVKAAFDEVLELSGERRQQRLQAIDDEEVRAEVAALLSAHEGAGEFLATPREPLEVGHSLGPYRITAIVGRGGMGDVYQAWDARLGRDVAIKVLSDPSLDARALARFRREARTIAALSHPNVLAIHDVGETGGLPYFVTELLEGETLRERLRRGPIPLPCVLDWARQIAGGLAAAHDRGLVHRDLKPENLFVLRDGRVKILDFGLSRSRADLDDREVDAHTLTEPGLVLGTPGYAAPEQVRAQGVKASADLFSFGAILFEMLTGRRAFEKSTTIDTLRAVLDEEPPPPSSLRAGAPRWLDAVVRRCLAKEEQARFQSARDLAFVLTPPAKERVRARSFLGAALGAFVGGSLLWGAVALWCSQGADAPAEPPRTYAITFSGRDEAPAVSKDGQFVAVASDREGTSRIWLHHLAQGGVVPLTDGPDTSPRFSPDGSQLLFTRAVDDGGSAVFRVPLLGGEARRVVEDASEADWSPDGDKIAFIRWRDDEPQARPLLMVANVDGSELRQITELEHRVRVRPRWSPDGTVIAATGLVQQPGAPQAIRLYPVDGSPGRTLPTPAPVGLVSAVAWEDERHIVYSQALSVMGNSAGSPARIVRQDVDDGSLTTLLWTPESSLVLDRWPGRGLVFDSRTSHQNLREVALSSGRARFLSRGTASDRQPVYSPSGEHLVFSSNRGTNLDLWRLELATGTLQRLTDHEGDDWDPAYTPDGKSLLWSSNRSGHFEIWMANADGSSPRQLSRDGVDAENPTATADGQWVVYASGAPGRRGVWRIRPDGSDATLLVPRVILPEVSPDGRFVLFQTNRNPQLAVVGVAEVATGRVVPFEIPIEVKKASPAILGRARWLPNGSAIAFLGQDERGTTGVFLAPFDPERSEPPRWTALGGFDRERIAESFGLSPDGERLVLAEWQQRSTVIAAVGLP